MRKFVLAAVGAGAALTLSACSEGSEAPPAGTATDEAASTGAVTDPAQGAATQADARLDPNTATAEQLGAVSGVSPELAAAIVAGRPYANVVALNTKLRETLSEEQAAAVRTHVFVPVNLNSASEEEIKLIPGMTSKMVHEFLEYRPYEDMNEFNREIGKYVDEAEVARFRTYVTL
jgi:DNA uptake protein ComE-like DNA-binding protein